MRTPPAEPAVRHHVESTGRPGRAGMVLLSLILVAAVANLNLSVANVALPDIGTYFDASQTALNLVAVGYSLGLAASVLYLGALGDRHGRKSMAIGGVLLSIPACLVAAWAPSIEVLVVRAHPRRTVRRHGVPDDVGADHGPVVRAGTDESIALWSGPGGAIASLGPLVSGALLEHFYWGSVFLVTLPLAVAALLLRAEVRPLARQRVRRTRSTTWGASCPSLSWAASSSPSTSHPCRTRGSAGGLARRDRGRRLASRSSCVSVGPPIPCTTWASPADECYWVAACAGIIVFGSLMGAMFIGQQFLQNVLGYSTLSAGRRRSCLPRSSVVLVAPRSREAGGRSRRPVHLAHRLCVRVPRLPDDAPSVEGGQQLLAGRPGLHVRRDRRRVRRDPGVALADRLGAGRARRDGFGDQQTSERDLGGGGLAGRPSVTLLAARLRHRQMSSAVTSPPRTARRSRAMSNCGLASPSLSAADTARHCPQYASRDHRRREVARSSTVPIGRTWPDSSPFSPAPHSCS